MAYDNFPNGITSMGVPVNGLFTNGNTFFCKPGTSAGGDDSYDGQTPSTPVDTLTVAKSKLTAGNNDVVYLIASSNTAANTTDYQKTTLTWSKDMSHLIGINAGQRFSQRSRIATSTSAAGASVAPLMELSGNGCRFEGLEIFAGAPGSAPTAALGGLLVSGSRNVIRGCHIAGNGDSTTDAVGQYSLKVTGSENFFEDCTIGIDTVDRISATYEMMFSGGATRNIFRRCRIVTRVGSGAAATMNFVNVPVNGIDRHNLFEDCIFINDPSGIAAGTTMTNAFSITGGGSPDGMILLKDCKFVGITNSESAASGKLGYYANGTGKFVFTAF